MDRIIEGVFVGSDKSLNALSEEHSHVRLICSTSIWFADHLTCCPCALVTTNCTCLEANTQTNKHTTIVPYQTTYILLQHFANIRIMYIFYS